MLRLRALTSLAPLVLATLSVACGDDGQSTPQGGGGAGGTPAALRPGDVCTPPTNPEVMVLRFEPARVFVPPCAEGATDCVEREVSVVFDPDVCEPLPVTFTSDDPSVAVAPAPASFDLYKPLVKVKIRGGTTPGATHVVATTPLGLATSTSTLSTSIEVVTLDPALPTCAGTAADDLLAGGDVLLGEGGLAGASIGLPTGADAPNQGSFLWSVEPFAADLTCGVDLTPEGYLALGPAITFGPESLAFRRDVPLSVPINPARMPAAARLRHLEVVYSGPKFQAPRPVAVSDVRFEQVGGHWALRFQAPRLGTYQAVVRSDAGTDTFQRRLTHRAVIGVSMGGGGTSLFGMRHHDLFDVLAPLGGPVDWTWMLDHIEKNHMAGFRPIAPGTQLADIQLVPTPCSTDAECAADESCLGVTDEAPGKCRLLPIADEPYEHASSFNTWWVEFPRNGTGGSFPRREYAQIFRDLALMFGNPNGENLSPGAEHLPAGVRPDDPSVLGDHQNGECVVWVDPLDPPDVTEEEEQQQKDIANSCPLERCANTLTLQGYFDDEYNPDGAFPVITVCDGSPQREELSPYANTWTPEGNDYPLEVALAVDYNGNGVRDELEPVIRAGHEPWRDTGVDGVPSDQEPGYAPGVNDDPNGDDYDAQYNPTGTEGDMRRQEGEPFDDVGLDGVPGTPQQPPGGWMQPGDGYDVGEGDGVFTVSRGLQQFWDVDSHSVVRQFSTPPGGDFDDEALSRIDLWTDGGTRDLFNFAVDATHLTGTFAARGRRLAYMSSFTQLPGLDPNDPNQYAPGRAVWEDLPGIVFQRYGKNEPNAVDIENGSGQHVGTALEIAARLQSALYFIGSRWDDPMLMTQVEESAADPDPSASQCEIEGNCTFEFESTFGRSGVVTVTLPPGYASAKQQDRSYPVIYMLHGYGQTPDDLGAAIVFLRNWMNSPATGMASRLPKAILVYVDGRCRVGADGKAECIRGSFFTDSPREGGLQNESWWLELMDYVDTNYRTMPEATVPWTE